MGNEYFLHPTASRLHSFFTSSRHPAANPLEQRGPTQDVPGLHRQCPDASSSVACLSHSPSVRAEAVMTNMHNATTVDNFSQNILEGSRPGSIRIPCMSIYPLVICVRLLGAADVPASVGFDAGKEAVRGWL